MIRNIADNLLPTKSFINKNYELFMMKHCQVGWFEIEIDGVRTGFLSINTIKLIDLYLIMVCLR